MTTHEYYMRRAIALAEKAKGKTFPNPLVGAVVVSNGKVAGEGYHRKAGMPHAETIALRKAKKKAEGAVLYINLEPCAHYGKTPPCVKNIIKNRIKKVYAAMKDPNPLVNGSGFRELRKNGVAVETGICREEAKRLNKVYLDFIRKTQPAWRGVTGSDVLKNYDRVSASCIPPIRAVYKGAD